MYLPHLLDVNIINVYIHINQLYLQLSKKLCHVRICTYNNPFIHHILDIYKTSMEVFILVCNTQNKDFHVKQGVTPPG